MCPLELTATPEASPRYMSGGSFRKFGTESNGISGGCCCANADGLNSMNAPTSHVLTGSVFMRSSLVLGSSMPWAKYTKRRGCKTIGPPIVFRADGTKRCGDNDGIHEDCGGRG